MKLLKRIIGQPPRGFTRILALDPGSKYTAFLWLSVGGRGTRIGHFKKVLNSASMLEVFNRPDVVVCEQIMSYGMPVGATVFDTVRFTGRLQQLCLSEQIPFVLMPRVKVKSSLKPLPRKNDSQIRGSLIKLYGSPGTKNQPGPTYGITKDVWAALGVAHAYRKQLLESTKQGTA